MSATHKPSSRQSSRGFSKDLHRVIIDPPKRNLTEEFIAILQDKFKQNYFGLPPYALQQNELAIAYQSRKPLIPTFYQSESSIADDTSQQSASNEKSENTARRALESSIETKVDVNYTSQRKVANALLTMVRNEIMLKHFLHKGGFEAVLKLVNDSKDHEVLTTCAHCLIEASQHPANCKLLIDKQIIGALNLLIEFPEDQMRHMAAIVLGNLSTAPDSESLLSFNNVLQMVQTIFSHVHRTDTLCFLLMILCNVSPAYTVQEAELLARLCSQICNKIKVEIVRYVAKATFVADVYSNLSRVSHYSSLLVEEGLLPLLIHLIDSHPNDEVLRRCTETLSNLSLNRKNRREIASSGIATRLVLIFEHGGNVTKANLLFLMGNLLSTGLFHDKVANEVTVSNMLDNLMDIRHPKQFNAVSYCLCQLSKVESSCSMLVQCSAIPIVLGYLRVAPRDSIDYLWTVVVNISTFGAFFEPFIAQIASIVTELYEEVRYDASTELHMQAVIQIALNLSVHNDLHTYMDTDMITMFVKTVKIIFSSHFATPAIQQSSLVTLINFAYMCKDSRVLILAEDLIELFTEAGVDDDKLNVKYAGLINIISNEESSCYKLLELGTQKFLVTLQDAFIRLTTGKLTDRKKNKKYKKGQSIHNLNLLMKSGDLFSETTTKEQKLTDPNYEYDAQVEGELGMALTAATLHNIALKRAILAPGVLQAIITLSKNCKTERVLHCIRALACMSAHPKSRVDLSKKSSEIIPLLTVIMRCGCVSAEKVQHYCAVILCNLTATPLDKAVLLKLIKDKDTSAITDLVVVTLLRINDPFTKESLGKAFFNLLIRHEIREALIVQLDMLAAIIELSKIENVELLTLCMRALFNVTCELRPGTGSDVAYAQKLLTLKVPHLMMARLKHVPEAKHMPGSQTTKEIRFILGMALANMSFNKHLVVEMTRDGNLIADALYRVFKLKSEEATYCAVVTLYNISQIPECVALVDSRALDLIVEVQSQECSVLCAKLCIAALCNFTMKSEYHERITTVSLPSIVNILSTASMALSIKIDAIQAIYNLVTVCVSARIPFIECDGVIALWKIIKSTGGGGGGGGSGTADGGASVGESSQGGNSLASDALEEDSVLILLSHIVKELCEDMSNARIQKKAMADGMMNIILKLSKIELAEIKVDMSFAIYSLTKGPELMKVLKWDSVDILFWLTIHDTLGSQDLINKNVSRALRSFSSSAEEGKVLLKQDRFLSVLKALIKSKNEDVLWQAAGVLYNLMQVQSSLKTLLSKGLVDYIFQIAGSGYDNVKHVCSACLHMIPEHMPNMEDPLVLELVLCLLEAQGDKFSEISEKPMDSMTYYNVVVPCFSISNFKHMNTDFKATWNVLTCAVDAVWTPALLFTPAEAKVDSVAHPMDAANSSTVEQHAKIKSHMYRNFVRDNTHMSVDDTMQGSWVNVAMAEEEEEDSLLLQGDMITTPGLTAKAPPALSNAGSMNSQALRVRINEAADDEGSVHSGGAGSSKHSGKSAGGGGNDKRTSRHMSMSRTPGGSLYQQQQFQQQQQNQAKYSTSAPAVKLPLIGAAPKVPENTIDAIQQSLKPGKKSSRHGGGSSIGGSSRVGAEPSYSIEFEPDISGDIGEHAFSVASATGKGGSSSSRHGSRVKSPQGPAGLSNSVLKSASSGSLAQVSFNKHGNIAR